MTEGPKLPVAESSRAVAAVVPFCAAMAAAVRAQPAFGVSVSLVVGVFLAPVWITHLSRYRWGRAVAIVGAVAGVWGLVLTVFDDQRTSSAALLQDETFLLLSSVSSIGLLLWARACLGAGWTVTAFGLGALVNAWLIGINAGNAWKFSLAIPVVLVLLGLAMTVGSRALELGVLVGAAGMSVLSDSRSMSALLLMTAVLVGWQIILRTKKFRARPWRALLGMSAVALSGYYAVQALILDGAFGSDAAERTRAQIDVSGSVIAGGRPEMGAAEALVSERPWGYGSGVVPSVPDLRVAQEGMARLNYDPYHNGYVETYMFGSQFEVHSVLGDFWLRFGPPGAVLVIGLCLWACYSTARAMSVHRASAALIWMTALGLWNVLFSPALTSYPTMALMVALAAVPSWGVRKPADHGWDEVERLHER